MSTIIGNIINSVINLNHKSETELIDQKSVNSTVQDDTTTMESAAATFDIVGNKVQAVNFDNNVTQKMKSMMTAYDANSVFANNTDNLPDGLVTTKRYLPDGSVEIVTKKGGKIVERNIKKPHMVPVHDPLSDKVKMEPFISIFDGDFM